LTLVINFPAEFGSNLDQTHMHKLIKVFRSIRKLQAGELERGWS